MADRHHRRATASGLLAALLLSACSLEPAYSPPQLAAPLPAADHDILDRLKIELRTGDVRREKRYVSINAKVRSEMAVPVEMRGQVVGLLNVDSTEIDAFSEADEERMVDMASEAAKWLELAWEIDQLRLKSRQLTSLVNTAQMITALHGLRGNDADRATFAASLRFLGFLSESAAQWEGSKRKAVGVDADRVNALISDRTAARARKDFKESDRIRDELAAMGVAIKDSKDGTTWEVAR